MATPRPALLDWRGCRGVQTGGFGSGRSHPVLYRNPPCQWPFLRLGRSAGRSIRLATSATRSLGMILDEVTGAGLLDAATRLIETEGRLTAAALARSAWRGRRLRPTGRY